MTIRTGLHGRRRFLAVAAGLFFGPTLSRADKSSGERHYLYVAEPGVRDYVQWGGAGILVFDIDNGHGFVRRIETPASHEAKADNIKGLCANAATGRMYFTTTKRLYCLDLLSEKAVWDKALPQGCDRLAITPDGKTIYVPSLERDIWNVVDAANGELLTSITTRSGAHNTVCGIDGTRMYLAGLKSPLLTVANPRTHQVVAQIGPFAAGIRPFTVNAAQTRVYVNVNDLLGFEIGDLTNGKKLARVEVQGFEHGPVKRHSCPSHGIGLTPDEKEIWVADAHNSRMHIFDLMTKPPKQIASLPLREQPGWVTFSLDGRFAYPSTGEVFDVKTKTLVTALKDEKGRDVHSEKMVEIDFRDGKSVRVGDQFGLGRAPH
jgi:DNA-binding beta-propeller fold protein YncE